jgi:hypothetical protein
MHGPVSATVEAKSVPSDDHSSRLSSRRLFMPSLSDVLFLVLISILFLSGAGWSGLLADGDTGWHIRTGQYILETHAVPVWDLFSYAAPGTHWYAWEWLADVVFAMCHQMAGPEGRGTVLRHGHLPEHDDSLPVLDLARHKRPHRGISHPVRCRHPAIPLPSQTAHSHNPVCRDYLVDAR